MRNLVKYYEIRSHKKSRESPAYRRLCPYIRDYGDPCVENPSLSASGVIFNVCGKLRNIGVILCKIRSAYWAKINFNIRNNPKPITHRDNRR